ncbi:nuclear transport factor 2 family protein [Sporichthya sp.]|uniref:nuclear transport factor 2 family protein n=1 Tax=Sporichthya sp. TaxID=65475 RepID=UPI00182005F4|nr:nuclear transport factor 2 family protein [Sporichthya sp.]MBA3741363.1 nuclear transport factor 2 family protein [Sporichthya sp.]
MSHSNADTITHLYELAAASKNEEMFGLINEILAPDVVLREATSLPFGGTFEGKANVLQALGAVMPFVDSSKLVPERILSDGDVVVALFQAVHWRAEGFTTHGVEVPAPTNFLEVWRFRDGKVVELQPWYFDQATVPKI